MLNRIMKMVDLQYSFNTNTNGIEWMNGVTKEGKKIDWSMAAILEVNEALDSLDWKWWKDLDSGHDIDNIKVELVDTMCFVLSAMISYYKIDDKPDYNKLEKVIASVTCYDIKQSEVFDVTLFKERAFKLMEYLMKYSYNNLQPYVLLSSLLDLIATIPGFIIDEVFNMYIAKDALNTVRQQLGYKDGTYIKIWDGVEDNVYVMNMLTEIDTLDMTRAEIVEMIIIKYNKINKIQPTLPLD